MMKYRILKDFLGSPDGLNAIQYRAGEVAELSASLAVAALEEGWAVVYDPQPQPKRAPRTKALKGAPENKQR